MKSDGVPAASLRADSRVEPRSRARVLVGLQVALAPVFAFHAMAAWVGTGRLPRRGLLADWVLATLAGAVLLAWQRRTAPALAVLSGGLGLLYAVSHAKREILQDWPRWADLTLLPELFESFPVPVGVGVALATLAAAAAALNLRRPGRPGLAAGMALLAAASLPLAQPELTRATVDALFPWYSWVGNDPLSRGLGLALARDAAETVLERRSLAGLEPLPLAPPSVRARAGARNVHVILAESLTDPRDLGPGFRQDSFDARLASWVGGRALSPSARGGSAQSEFELLCGLPATAALPDPVVFNGLGGRPAPCLPRRLAARGYHTRVSVPLEPWFYNARRSYRSLGFAEALFARDLPGADHAAPNATRALMEHNRRWLAKRLPNGGPLFNHVVTVRPHHPFRGPYADPPLEAGSPTRTRFATGLRDATTAIADHVSWLRARDPTAVILVVGDHQAPGIGATGRTAASILGEHGVPLALLLEGEPLDVGLVAHFQLTERLLGILDGAPPTEEAWLRPLRGGRLLFPRGPAVGACPSPAPECGPLRGRVAALESRTRRLVAMAR